MRYEDQQLLQEWAKLQFHIARAKCQLDALNMNEDRITHSVGYKKLREWFMGLSDRAKQGARRFMRTQIVGVRELLAKAKATGERIEYGDIVIETFDEAGEAVKPIALDTGCSASGEGIPGVVGDYVKCPKCLARWHAHDIGFQIPDHEAVTA